MTLKTSLFLKKPQQFLMNFDKENVLKLNNSAKSQSTSDFLILSQYGSLRFMLRTLDIDVDVVCPSMACGCSCVGFCVFVGHVYLSNIGGLPFA